MIPATPIAGTADPNPLVTLSEYQLYTTDTDSTNALNFPDVLEDALDQVQRWCNRTLLYGQYDERLFVYKSGMVYPSAAPIDQTKPVSTNASTPDPGNSIFQGDGIWVGWFIPLPALPVWEGVVPPQTDITYWGGYVGSQSSNPQQPLLPARLKRAICKVCWFILNPVALSEMPGGVKSVAMGGVSISGDLSSMVDSDDALRRDLRRFQRRLGKHWDS